PASGGPRPVPLAVRRSPDVAVSEGPGHVRDAAAPAASPWARSPGNAGRRKRGPLGGGSLQDVPEEHGVGVAAGEDRDIGAAARRSGGGRRRRRPRRRRWRRGGSRGRDGASTS